MEVLDSPMRSFNDRLQMRGTPLDLIHSHLLINDYAAANTAFKSTLLEALHDTLDALIPAQNTAIRVCFDTEQHLSDSKSHHIYDVKQPLKSCTLSDSSQPPLPCKRIHVPINHYPLKHVFNKTDDMTTQILRSINTMVTAVTKATNATMQCIQRQSNAHSGLIQIGLNVPLTTVTFKGTAAVIVNVATRAIFTSL